jgi:hypothetical protein
MGNLATRKSRSTLSLDLGILRLSRKSCNLSHDMGNLAARKSRTTLSHNLGILRLIRKRLTNLSNRSLTPTWLRSSQARSLTRKSWTNLSHSRKARHQSAPWGMKVPMDSCVA